ncbi:hypothetical protein [Streptomyces chartreusis]|uniref:hypothetical protein n=1 Tax=Streptomyces chartreusis TaxID=1969 RepID=UPI003D73EA67
MGREDQPAQDSRTACGLGAGAAAVTLLVAGEHHKALWPAAGLLTGAVIAIRRVLREQPHASWIARAAATVNALLLSWAEPPGRPVGLALAAALALGACVLFARWRQHRI